MNHQVTQHKRSNTKWFLLGLVLLAFLTLPLRVMADFSPRGKITSSPRGVGAQFGNAVAISGNTMVVGARFDGTTASQAGAAFVYVLIGTTWTQQAKLLANDGAVADKFGQSVAISGDTIIIGAYQANAPLSNGGAAYVFVRSGTTWTQQQKLTAGDGTADDEFGVSVAISGETVFVGAHFADLPSNSEAGAVYIFARGGTVWTQVQKLIPAGGVVLGDHLGESLAISGDKLVVGSPGADDPQTAAGSVYVFVKNGGAYIQQQKLFIVDGDNGDSFGFSVAIEGNTLVGGAQQDTPIVGQTAAGAAYVFEFNGTTWAIQQKLTAADSAAFDRFGWSVAVSANVIAVGAREDDTAVGPDAGSAYLFTRVGTTWTQKQKLAPADPFNDDRFGVSVALSSGNLLVGAAEKNLTNPNGQGAVYAFSSVRLPFPDFDGDGKADVSIYRLTNGTWYTRRDDSSSLSTQLGSPGDLIAPADYDGDGKTDHAVFRPSTGDWFVLRSSNATTFSTHFGTAGDLPVPADYDGDGLADISFFRPLTGEWLRINSSNSQTVTVTLGMNGDIPLIGDFDGDGRSDPSYFRPSTATLVVRRSSDNQVVPMLTGAISDIPVPADYDGDGKTDAALFRNGIWGILQSSDQNIIQRNWGEASDNPVPADYDGDGSSDLAVFTPSSAMWRILSGTGSRDVLYGIGFIDDPIPLFFVRQRWPLSSVQFSANNYNVNEDPTAVTITVTRTGNTSGPISVSYATSDGSAKQTTDYTVALGILYFAAGETSKTFAVPISEDSLVEGTESLTLTLSNAFGGAALGAPGTATLTILDDAIEPAANPIDVPLTYVDQHYHDFLNREGDASGLAFWTDQITSCGANAQCIELKRINVSGAYFLSIEFQETGYLVYRFYNVALNRSNGLPRYAEFLQDTQRVGRDVVVGAAGWQAILEANKSAYADEFVGRAEFTSLYPLTQTPDQFVDALYAHAAIVPTPAERQAAIAEFNSNPPAGRARVLRRLADNQTYSQREFNRAFVLMQYFGYLRRNPDDAPDNNLSGYNFWLAKLNQFNGNFIQAEMVKAFILSGEYRLRFGLN